MGFLYSGPVSVHSVLHLVIPDSANPQMWVKHEDGGSNDW